MLKASSFFCSFKGLFFFRGPNTTLLINDILNEKAYILSSKYRNNMDFSPPLKVCSTSFSIKRFQVLSRNSSSWDIERLRCKSETGWSEKINSQFSKDSIVALTGRIFISEKRIMCKTF